MDAYYERFRDDEEIFELSFDRALTFPPHFHESVEIVAVGNGSYGVTLNGKNYELGKYSVFFADSYDVHSYEYFTGDFHDNVFLLIPAKFLVGFKELKNGKRVTENVVKSEKLYGEILGIAKNYLSPHRDDETVLKAGTDLVLSLVSPFLGLSGENKDDDSLIRKILVYAQENFKDGASLHDLAKKSGYSKEHLSRTFHKYIKRGFPDYVNSLRLDYVEKELRAGGDKKITTLLFDAGFNSIQAYYRAKSKRR